MEYDLNYFDNMLRIYSRSAEEICQRRWAWIAEAQPSLVLDYGCGVGWFRAYAPAGVRVDTFDVMPVPQTGVSPVVYDCVCFWDVLEHIPDFSVVEPVFRLANFAACTVPVVGEGQDLAQWKHFKPGEHLHYFHDETLKALFRRYGFRMVKCGTPECPPRVDVRSYLFSRVEAVWDEK